jgi:hypothetical protein
LLLCGAGRDEGLDRVPSLPHGRQKYPIFEPERTRPTALAVVNATFFELPVSLFPAVNAERFGGDPRTRPIGCRTDSG